MPLEATHQLKLLLPKYQHLDPSKHSLNDHFGLIRKRTSLQNFLHRLVRLLTFGLKSNNPALDRATVKLIRCAEDVLKNAKFDASAMRDLNRIVSLHVRVVKRNGGKKELDLSRLLNRIKQITAAPKYQDAEFRKMEDLRCKEARLLKFMEACFNLDSYDLTDLPAAADVAVVWPGTYDKLKSRHKEYCEIDMMTYYLLKVTGSLMHESSEKKRYLPSIAKIVALAMPSTHSSRYEDPVWWELFAQGDCTFQARTIKDVAQAHLFDSQYTSPYLARLKSASVASWQKAGETSTLYVWNLDRLSSLLQSQRPECWMAFLNGAVSHPLTGNKTVITTLLGHMIQPHRDAVPCIDAWPLEQLSSQVWALFDSNFPIPKSGIIVSDQKDFLWYTLSRHLNHPQTERQKRLFIHFTQQFFARDLLLPENSPVRAFFDALTPADISIMPLEKYHPAHRFLLALRSKSLSKHRSLLKETAKNMTELDHMILLALFRTHSISLQEKRALVDLLKEPKPVAHPLHAHPLHAKPTIAQPFIVQHLLREFSMHKLGVILKFTSLVRSNQWQAAWDFAQGLEEETRDHFIKALRQETLPMPKDVTALNKSLFFLAFFDPKARANLLKMVQEGRAGDCLSRRVAEMEALSKQEGLPEAVKKTIDDFFKSVRRAVHVGNLKCPLRDQYMNATHADLTVKLPEKNIPAHRALLSLDPFFKAFLSPPKKEIEIPEVKAEEALLRLKWLYNNLTIGEIAKPATQAFLQEAKNLKPLFASLFNQKDSADIFVKGSDEGEGIHAHRFMLQSAFPFFEGLFRAKMKDSAALSVTLQQMTHDQLKAALAYLYSNEKPEFSDQQSEEAFQEAWKFLKASNKPAGFKP